MPSDPSNVNFDLNIEENEEEETDPSFDASSQLNHVLKWIMSYGEWKKEVQHRHGLEVEETPIKQEKKSSKVGTGIFAKNWRTGEAMTQQAPAAEDEYEKYESLITDISFGFLVQFLDHVKATLPQGVGEGPHVVYEFTWHPEENEVVSCQKLTGEKGVAASFIPDWFTQWLDSQHTST
ncbi:hypothetical protein B566_EDAN007548 [Ephemera danica]|nr:hypothetical protein B566_EDAN007548 [Ephemera danica]